MYDAIIQLTPYCRISSARSVPCRLCNIESVALYLRCRIFALRGHSHPICIFRIFFFGIGLCGPQVAHGFPILILCVSLFEHGNGRFGLFQLHFACSHTCTHTHRLGYFRSLVHRNSPYIFLHPRFFWTSYYFCSLDVKKVFFGFKTELLHFSFVRFPINSPFFHYYYISKSSFFVVTETTSIPID